MYFHYCLLRGLSAISCLLYSSCIGSSKISTCIKSLTYKEPLMQFEIQISHIEHHMLKGLRPRTKGVEGLMSPLNPVSPDQVMLLVCHFWRRGCICCAKQFQHQAQQNLLLPFLVPEFEKGSYLIAKTTYFIFSFQQKDDCTCHLETQKPSGRASRNFRGPKGTKGVPSVTTPMTRSGCKRTSI